MGDRSPLLISSVCPMAHVELKMAPRGEMKIIHHTEACLCLKHGFIHALVLCLCLHIFNAEITQLSLCVV